MAIEGPLKELGIHDVFQLLDLNRKTGVLRVRSELRHNQGTVWFQNGVVVYAHIRSNPHPLGDLLIRSGKIAAGDLDRARAMQAQGDARKIGDILVEVGAVNRTELERHVRFQIEEVIFEMMSWREGYFSFVEESIDDVPAEASVDIRIESLLMEGARRIDEWSRMERKIPHVGVVPVLAPAGDGVEGALDLLPTEWEVLASVDGVSDVRSIATNLARSEFDVAKTLFGLESAGALTILSGPSGQPGDGATAVDLDALVEEAEESIERGDAAGARSIVESVIASHPHDARLFLVLARVHLDAKRDAEAEDNLRRALRLDALYAPAHRLLGNALARQGRFSEACSWWDRWLKLHEESGEGHHEAMEVREALAAAETLHRFLRNAHE